MKRINISRIIRESIESFLLNEDKTVTFGGQVDPKYGWAVIMCGAPGAGKSSAARQHLPIQGKIISSDYFREVYADMINAKNKDRVIDLKKSSDIMAVDKLVGYKGKNFYQKNLDNIKKANASIADLVLLDNGDGGTGKPFNWEFLNGIKREFILAGGLNAENVGLAIEKCHPIMVDASSSIETNRVKDKEKMAAFVAAVRR